MNPTAFTFAGYIIWFLILSVGIITHRSFLTLAGKRAANSFKPDGTDISALSARLCRAHANCYESFPFVGGLLLLALATNLTQVTDSLAFAVLACRIGQSTVHLISTSVLAVQIRFLFFLAQIVISFYWVIQLIMHFTT